MVVAKQLLLLFFLFVISINFHFAHKTLEEGFPLILYSSPVPQFISIKVEAEITARQAKYTVKLKIMAVWKKVFAKKRIS